MVFFLRFEYHKVKIGSLWYLFFFIFFTFLSPTLFFWFWGNLKLYEHKKLTKFTFQKRMRFSKRTKNCFLFYVPKMIYLTVRSKLLLALLFWSKNKIKKKIFGKILQNYRLFCCNFSILLSKNLKCTFLFTLTSPLCSLSKNNTFFSKKTATLHFLVKMKKGVGGDLAFLSFFYQYIKKKK
jgi:hypothetical protein